MAETSDEIIRICSCWHSPLIHKSVKQHQKCRGQYDLFNLWDNIVKRANEYKMAMAS